ncbi:hypothetical protein FRC12_004508 [Ceratobasidium sp. 428]|nr:hypothetical protein FRC12_004508 [Ceratobasidium sp. 428]
MNLSNYVPPYAWRQGFQLGLKECSWSEDRYRSDTDNRAQASSQPHANSIAYNFQMNLYLKWVNSPSSRSDETRPNQAGASASITSTRPATRSYRFAGSWYFRMRLPKATTSPTIFISNLLFSSKVGPSFSRACLMGNFAFSVNSTPTSQGARLPYAG